MHSRNSLLSAGRSGSRAENPHYKFNSYKMDNATTHSRSMAQKNAQVVYIKNISADDFTHSYDAVPYQIAAGATLAYPYPIAMHLAKHLAMRNLRAEKVKAGKVGGKDEAGRTVNMYSAIDLDKKIAEIVKETIAQELPAVQTEAEIMQQKTKDMQEKFPGKKKTRKRKRKSSRPT